MPPRVMSLPVVATGACGPEPQPRPLAQLTRDMKRMNDDAWTEFHQRYFTRLFHYALRLHHGDRATAEDTVQAAYLRAVRHIRRFDDESVFWSWLTLLLRCAAVDRGRKIFARNRLQERLLHEIHPDRAADHSGTAVAEDLRAIFLEEAVLELDVADRDLLRWKYTDGEATIELADRLDATPKAIECRLRRLRRKLKSRIHALARTTSL